jgi:hypothetical protein
MAARMRAKNKSGCWDMCPVGLDPSNSWGLQRQGQLIRGSYIIQLATLQSFNRVTKHSSLARSARHDQDAGRERCTTQQQTLLQPASDACNAGRDILLSMALPVALMAIIRDSSAPLVPQQATCSVPSRLCSSPARTSTVAGAPCCCWSLDVETSAQSGGQVLGCCCAACSSLGLAAGRC